MHQRKGEDTPMRNQLHAAIDELQEVNNEVSGAWPFMYNHVCTNFL